MAGVPEVETGAGTDDPAEMAGDRADLLSLYRALLLPRLIEHKMLALLRRGDLSKWFSGLGQEAVSVGVVEALEADDWILPTHRNLGVFCGRKVDLARLFRQLLGRDGGFTKGRDRTFHFGSLDHHVVGMISHMGAMLPVANGLALAAQLRHEDRVAVALVGDGATSEGDVHEAMNLAAVWTLPVVFVIENNQWALSTPAADQYACAQLVDRAAGYGMPGERVDGNDVLAVRRAVRDAAARARAGHGPTLLECLTYRMRGHEEASGVDYMPTDELDRWAEDDPVRRVERTLEDRGWLDEEQREQLRAEVQADIDALVADALAAPRPASDPATERADVYAPPRPLRRLSATGSSDEGDAAGARELRYIDAVTDGLRQAMQADERVVLLGQDIAEYGGVFKVTAGFVEEFGRERVRNTPIVESGALGAALGLALDGFRPIVEMQFGDFLSCGFNQLVNNLATTHYRWGAPVPVVVRAPVGGGLGAGPFHSQNIEPWFTGIAGLRIVAPATPADAKGLLLAALDDGNPVLFLEHKWLYRNSKGPVPSGHHTVPIGQARISRPGRDATVVTYGVGVTWALAAAEALSDAGEAEVEVVDLRSLQPWDRDSVLDSVRRTSRVLVLHEAPAGGGFGDTIAATIADEAFAWLDAPVRRLGGLDTPIPFTRPLEAVWSAEALVLPALRSLLAF